MGRKAKPEHEKATHLNVTLTPEATKILDKIGEPGKRGSKSAFISDAIVKYAQLED
jgi:hypothetical protein